MLAFIKAQVKKIFVIMTLAIPSSFLFISTARADDGMGTYYLMLIASYTHDMLKTIDQLPTYLAPVTKMAMDFVTPDTSDTTATVQASFSNLNNAILTDQDKQNSIQKSMITNFLAGKNADENTLQGLLPYANEISYSTMQGYPVISAGMTNPLIAAIAKYNYLQNASGMGVSHVIPNKNWDGSDENKDKYTNFYKTITSVQTYDAYVLSQVYAEAISGNNVTKIQKQLMQQASDGENWFAQVSSESMGAVLRQTLMYNSQIFVVLMQMLQVQKQQAALSAMSNSLVILGNQFNEENLLRNAKVGRK